MAGPLPLCVPSNLQEDLLDLLDLTRVREVYGKLQEDPLGGGRSSLILPRVSRRMAARHIRSFRDRGISFNYLLNATCMDNREFTRQGRRQIEDTLAFALDCGADVVTVSIPFLLELTRALHPGLRVAVSTMTGVDSPEMAAYFQKLGADRITLSVTDVNRDFERLAAIRRQFKGELQVIANLECLRGCPFTRHHGNINSHSSQTGHESGGFVVDVCYLSCSTLRLEDPGHFFKAGWIRPEDQHHYAAVGIDSIKLVSRAMASEQIARIVSAYTAGRYEGNLLDLFSHPTNNLAYRNRSRWSELKYMLKPSRMNLWRLSRYKDVFRWPIPTIDNRSLDGFIDFFVQGKCRPSECEVRCRYCFEVAERTFRMDEVERRKALEQLGRLKRDLLSGDIFRWGP